MIFKVSNNSMVFIAFKIFFPILFMKSYRTISTSIYNIDIFKKVSFLQLFFRCSGLESVGSELLCCYDKIKLWRNVLRNYIKNKSVRIGNFTHRIMLTSELILWIFELIHCTNLHLWFICTPKYVAKFNAFSHRKPGGRIQ